MLTAPLKRINTISGAELKRLYDFFGVNPRKGVLKVCFPDGKERTQTEI